MFETPDLSTLRLCSVLASTAFALVFLWLWRGRWSIVYLAHWAISLILYIAVIVAFELLRGPPGVAPGALLFATLAGSNIFVASGVALFERRRPFAPWMAIPSLVSAAGFVIGGRELAAFGLALGMAMFGTALVRGKGATTRGRRIAGVALLGYVPGYVCAILGDMTQLGGFDRLASIAMLLDQMLLPVLYLGLLAMPGERAMRGLRDLATADPLTATRNRGWMAHEEARLAVAGTAVVLIDVDHFKTINDSHGHAGGDAALVELARRMMALASARGGAVVRIGGDEFLVLLPRTDGPAAARFAEAARDAATVVVPGIPPCTVSVGVDGVRASERVLADAVARADRALYRAKAAGRDRVAA